MLVFKLFIVYLSEFPKGLNKKMLLIASSMKEDAIEA